jgi:hypothetical protein
VAVVVAAVEREMRDVARVSFYREANRGCSLLAGQNNEGLERRKLCGMLSFGGP